MQRQVAVRVSVAWWLRWYIAGVVWMSDVTGLAPDVRKMAAWLAKAIRVKVI